MIDLSTNKVIMSKPIRRKTFILGKSSVLLNKSVVVMDDGTIRVVTVRRPDYWADRPQYVCAKLWGSTEADFESMVQRLREFEADYITAELPETV